jgi:hypothetical protein
MAGFPKDLLTDTSDNQDYSKTPTNKPMEGPTMDQGKDISQKPMDMIKGGGKTGTSGPTESSRDYPKGKGPSMSPDFNPMNVKATGYATDGVGKGED